MGRLTELLAAAQDRSRAGSRPFAGELLPHEAYELLQLAPGSRLIDVRSRAELEFNGTIPGAVHVEWQSWPGWAPNRYFLTQLAHATDSESLLFFLCRNGTRSQRAAAAVSNSGRGDCYNVLEGFEGDLNPANGHRSEINGWKRYGLPWTQG